jgi:polysaccharide export outer membrane protein
MGEIGAESLARREAGFTTTPAASGSLDIQPLAPGYPSAPIHPLEMVRRPNPYRDVPSLFDMYVQATPDPQHPKRFGAEIFLNGTRDPKTIPMDLPAGPDYILGPGDSLTIDLWGSVAQRISRTVDREGRVSIPQAGPILVSGKNLADVQQSLQLALRSQFRNVSADVSLTRLRTVRVYEVGDVAQPGAYDVSSLATPLSALFLAGGPTPSGSMRILKHYRGNQLVQTIDVYDLLLHGVKANIEPLENGDTILVPTIGPQVTVEGMVRRPAVYELRDEKMLAEVLALSGGLLPVATLRHIEVQRIVDHRKQDLLSLDIPDSDTDAEATRKIEAFQIHDGDEVRVFPIAPYNETAIFVAGHVVRPGKYSYHEGMRVTDLISSYQDLLPEPARQHAEIIHLNPPDDWPSVQTFDLGEALDKPSQAPLLRPLDTVRIFSRFDFEDPPAVSVGGAVRAPGTFQTPGQLRLVDAIHLAGGLQPGAETDDVQVLRYLAEGTLRIFSVNLARALKGELDDNIVLEPRDQLLIHRNPNEIEPSSIYLQGQVARPGHYPLSANMRVSDLIRIGGGLLAGADTQTAELTQHDVAGPGEIKATNVTVALSSLPNGDAGSDAMLHNGDVLTIRQIPGWNDLGATINVTGEVRNPGIYGIRPGERLSSVLQRAGGFQADAYPYGAVLQRKQVRELESQAQVAMVLRVKESENTLDLLPDKDAAQKQAKDATLQQWQATLDGLAANPPIGRVAVRIGPDLKAWQNTPADIEVRAGDNIAIPKTPSYVMVTGQVFNATAIAIRPGKSANWYLGQAGGPTPLANRKAVFVIRADGSVIGSKKTLWVGDSLNAPLRPGDTVVVPEKPFGGPVEWQTIFAAAQVASAVASTVFIALRY